MKMRSFEVDGAKCAVRAPHLPLRLFLLCIAIVAGSTRAAAGGFDFEMLRAKAKALAAQPYVEAPSRVPEWLLKLSYDEHRKIRSNPNRSWWRQDGLPFQLQFFHPGFLLNRTVQISEIDGGKVEPIKFDRKFFIYDDVKTGELPSSMGFAGFRILYPLNKPDDELGAFQGASYFRMLCRDAIYGLSARGLALNTAEPGGEEFPTFTDFWVEKPAADANAMTVYALLNSPSVAGAYRFVLHPGAETVVDVRMALYFRRPVKTVGIAPLTSMFWHGENTNEATDDFRPEVHDSDGLMIQTGAGEWVWRPLTNPKSVRVAAFGDEKPRGFGLFQRDRDFSHYQDLEALYNRRPSVWVEPQAGWGRGSVRLVEIPTPDESNDNIVAFWCPDKGPAGGAPLELEYRLHWFMDQIRPPAGYTVSTRHGRTKTHETDLERFVVNFTGPYLSKQGPDPAIQPVVTVGQGAQLAGAIVQKNTYDGSWRVAFAIKPDGSGHPVELRCFLRKPPHVLTETWTYLWQP
ncbi:MAG TPA: glucan biosynthesis protein G [Opitutus sp.]|nr:glucan biosynthesis protein G [Opitutus sp.]